jgi:hypothetical protein
MWHIKIEREEYHPKQRNCDWQKVGNDERWSGDHGRKPVRSGFQPADVRSTYEMRAGAEILCVADLHPASSSSYRGKRWRTWQSFAQLRPGIGFTQNKPRKYVLPQHFGSSGKIHRELQVVEARDKALPKIGTATTTGKRLLLQLPVSDSHFPRTRLTNFSDNVGPKSHR